MTDAVARPYLDNAIVVTRMARALQGAPPSMMASRAARILAYESFGALDLESGEFDRLDAAAVASEMARRKATDRIGWGQPRL